MDRYSQTKRAQGGLERPLNNLQQNGGTKKPPENIHIGKISGDSGILRCQKMARIKEQRWRLLATQWEPLWSLGACSTENIRIFCYFSNQQLFEGSPKRAMWLYTSPLPKKLLLLRYLEKKKPYFFQSCVCPNCGAVAALSAHALEPGCMVSLGLSISQTLKPSPEEASSHSGP